MDRSQFLPDGGMAVAAGKLSLPARIMLTQTSVQDQLLKEVLPGRTMVCVELFGHMFSFLIPMKPGALLDHFDTHALLTLHSMRIGPKQVSVELEVFRDVICEVQL